MEENQINFFLEECLMTHLLQKNYVKLPNDFIENNQKMDINLLYRSSYKKYGLFISIKSIQVGLVRKSISKLFL